MAFNNFNFITSRLATGGGPATPEDVAELVAVGITHMIDCREKADPVSLDILCLYNPTPDDGQPKPVEWFQRSIEFALSALNNPKNRVYAHCHSGINRGPSTAYAILRAWAGIYHEDARMLIVKRRPIDLIGIRYAGDADKALVVLGYST